MIVVFFTSWPGHDLRREHLLRRLFQLRGWDLRLVRLVRSSVGGPGPVEEGVEVHALDAGSPVGPEARSSAFLRYLHEIRPEWLISYGTKNRMLYELPPELGARRASVVGGGYRDHRLGRLDLILAETGDQVRDLTSRWPRLPVLVMPKLVPREFFGIGVDRDIDILGLGRHVEQKAYSTLVPLLGEGFRVVLAGDGEETDALRRAARPHATVRVPGALDEQSVAGLARRSRVLAHPATHGEGLPRAICEAMAAGCVPVFRSEVVRSSLVEAGGAVSVPPGGDVNDAIRNVLADRMELARRSTMGIQVAEREWSPRAVDEFAPVLSEALAVGRVRRLLLARRERRQRPDRYASMP